MCKKLKQNYCKNLYTNQPNTMLQYYIICVGDGNNFKNNSKNSIWAVKSRQISFLTHVKKGDKLWFIKYREKGDREHGKLLAVADFVSKNIRVIGPNNDELGWDDTGGFCDVEIHFNNLYNLSNHDLYTGLKYQNAICPHEHIDTTLLINLSIEYEYISRYSMITRTL